MPSMREQIMDAIMAAQTASGGATGIAAGGFYRSRVAAVNREEGRTLVVTAHRDDSSQIIADKLERRLLVSLSIIERSVVPDDNADASISSVYSRMMADMTLGGKCIDVQPEDVIFEYGDADQPALVVSLQFRIYYRHSLTSLDS